MNNLATALVDLGDEASAERIARRVIRLQPQPPDRYDSTSAHSLSVLGRILIQQDQLPEAERVLSQCLAWRLKELYADHWQIGYAKSLLGESLARQSRFEEAEPLLLEGYSEMNASPRAWKLHVRQAAERLAALYEAWGKPGQAAEWRGKLAALQESSALKSPENLGEESKPEAGGQ